MEQSNTRQIVRTIEGVVQLCLGEAGRIHWVSQADAAAFSDGGTIYLPKPLGDHPDEYALILAMALREVSKMAHSDAAVFAGVQPEHSTFAAIVEDVRVKDALKSQYLGSPAVFAKAFGVAMRQLEANPATLDKSAEMAAQMAVWATANSRLASHPESAPFIERHRCLAEARFDVDALKGALDLAAQSAGVADTASAVALGESIYQALRTVPEQPNLESHGQEHGSEGPEQGTDDSEGDGDGGQSDSHPQPESEAPSQDGSGEGPQDLPETELNEPQGAESTEEGETGHEQEGHPAADQEVDSDSPEGSEHSDQQSAGEGQGDEQVADDGGLDPAPQDSTSPDTAEGGDQQDASESSQLEDGIQNSRDLVSSNQEGTGEAGGDPDAGEHETNDQASLNDESKAGTDSGEDPADAPGSPQATDDGGSPQPGPCEQNGEEHNEPAHGGSGSSTEAEYSPLSVDFLSQALAAMRGFPCARPMDASADVEESASGANDTFIQAITEALNDPQCSVDSLFEVGEVDSVDQESACDDAVDLVGAIGDGAGGGFAQPGDDADHNLLPNVPARLVSVLLRELQDRRRRIARLRSSGPRVDATRIWRMRRLGDMDVFRKKAPVHGIDCAVSILLDTSASMSDDIEMAAQVTYALALAFQRVSGVQTSIDAFPGESASVEELLRFKQPIATARSEIEAVRASGGTPTGRALAWRLERILEVRCEKRFVFVITDGEPNLGDIPVLNEALELAAQQNVEVIGIGIGDKACVEDHFASFVKVQTVADLPRELEALFKKDLAQRLAA